MSCDRKSSPSGVSGPANPADSSRKPIIVASIFPLQSILTQMTGDWIEVDLMMPSGASPHDFEPMAAQIAPLSQADMLVVVGLNLDEWAEQAAGRIGRHDLQIERMADLVGPRLAVAHPEGEPATAAVQRALNQHLWMDPQRTIRFIHALAPILQSRYPAHRDEVQKRSQNLIDDLQDLDSQARRALGSVPEKEMITYHNAYDLLAERYGLHVVCHLTEIELSPGGEVTPQALVETMDAIKRYHLQVIYAEPQFPGRAVEMIHEQTGVAIMSLDDLGGPNRPGYETYQSMLRTDVKILAQGQSLIAARVVHN